MRNVFPKILLLALLCLAHVASAQPGDSDPRRAAYREGYAAIQAKKWDDAYAIFLRLWHDAPTYDVALHLGHAEFNLGKSRDAAEHLAFGIAHLPPGETQELADGSRRALERVKQDIGTVTLIVDRPGATVRVDGDVRGKTPIDFEIFVDPGAHTIDASLEGYKTSAASVQIAKGEHQNVVLKLEPDPAASAAGAAAPAASGAETTPGAPADEHGSGSNARTIALISGAGVALVAGVATLIFAVNGSSAADRADDARAEAGKYGPNACGAPATAPAGVCASIQDAEDDRVAANRGANISLAVTGVAVVATATMFFVWPKATAGKSASVTVMPTASRGSGGLLLNGTF